MDSPPHPPRKGAATSPHTRGEVEPAAHEPAHSVFHGTAQRSHVSIAGSGNLQAHDVTSHDANISIAGSGNVVSFSFGGPGPARALELNGVTFTRIQ